MLYMDFWKTFQILDKNCLILYFLVTHTEFIIIQNRKKQGQKYAFDSLNLIFTVENNLWKSPLMSFFWGGGLSLIYNYMSDITLNVFVSDVKLPSLETTDSASNTPNWYLSLEWRYQVPNTAATGQLFPASIL